MENKSIAEDLRDKLVAQAIDLEVQAATNQRKAKELRATAELLDMIQAARGA